MKKNLQRRLKFILFSSILFYIGFIVVGVIPYYFYDELFWDSNLIMRIIGGIIGFTLIIAIMSNIQASFQIIRPYNSLINYIVISNIILTIIVIDIGFSNISDSYELFAAISFTSIGVIVIVLNIVDLIIFNKTSQGKLVENWNHGVDKLPDTYNNQTGILNLSNVIVFIFISATLFNFNMDSFMDFALLLFISGFVIYNYHKDYVLSKKRIVLESSIYVVLFIMSTFILISFNELLTEHVILRGIVILSPFTHIMIKIIPNNYRKMWLEAEIE